MKNSVFNVEIPFTSTDLFVGELKYIGILLNGCSCDGHIEITILAVRGSPGENCHVR